MGNYPIDLSAGKSATLEQLENLTLAVSDGRVRYYAGDGTNKAGEWARSVHEAVWSGLAFFVGVDLRILALDADDAGQSAGVERIAALLKECGIVPVVVASGQPDRKHLFALIVDPALKALLEQMARAYKISARTGTMIRPPLTRHRDLRYRPQLLSPATVAEAIIALTVSVTTRGIMSARRWRLLEKGDVDRRWLKSDGTPDRSHGIASWLTSAIDAGFSDDTIKRLLRDPAHRLGEKVREKDLQGDGERWLDFNLRRAKKWLAIHPPVKINVMLDRIEARAFDHPEHWHGRAGATAFAVLTFFLMVAHRTRSLDFGAARREVMEWTGIMDPQTFRRATRELVALAYTRRLTPDPVFQTNRFELLPCGDVPNTPILGPSRREEDEEQNGWIRDGVPEVFKVYRGLGLSAFHLWLVADGRTELEIAKALKVPVYRVRPRLATLERYGLADRDDAGRWWYFADRLDAAAKQRDTFGAKARQRVKYLGERARWRGDTAWPFRFRTVCVRTATDAEVAAVHAPQKPS
jgi:hypothetical protein